MKYAALIAVLAVVTGHMHGQTRIRKLASNINHPSINLFAPYISLDGSTLVYISDYGEDNALILNYTTKKDAVNWNDPRPMQKAVNNRLTYIRGFALSENGKTIWITSLKGGGLGGYDIHVSEYTSAGWSEPQNLGLPINSKLHDGAPSLTADGNTMYFMRCETMDRNQGGNCRILVAQKNYRGIWEEPVELPPYINTGNSQVPRILGDGSTLVFSSNHLPGNQGGMDLYETRLDGTTWSPPVALAFANTDKDDQFVSATFVGRHLMKAQPGLRSSELVEILFPEELKPLSTMKVEGTVSGVTTAYITVYDHTNKRRAYTGQPSADGSFTIYLSQGSLYELSIEPQQDHLSYFSKSYDMTGDRFQISDKIEALIAPIKPGDTIELSGLSFEEHTAKIAPGASEELRRVSRLIKGNPDQKFTLDLTYFGYQEDSIQSDPDLTEHVIDSSYVQILKQVPIPLLAQSLEYDSLDIEALQLDTLNHDTLITVITDSLIIHHTYHNDRTPKQTEAIMSALGSQGVNIQQIEPIFRAAPEMPADHRRTVVRLRVQ